LHTALGPTVGAKRKHRIETGGGAGRDGRESRGGRKPPKQTVLAYRGEPRGV